MKWFKVADETFTYEGKILNRIIYNEDIGDDIVFEMELVKQVEVNIDYILMLVAKYHKSNCKDKEILIAIDRAIKSSLELRSKKELIDTSRHHVLEAAHPSPLARGAFFGCRHFSKTNEILISEGKTPINWQL